jgi:hypothetical protein
MTANGKTFVKISQNLFKSLEICEGDGDSCSMSSGEHLSSATTVLEQQKNQSHYINAPYKVLLSKTEYGQ